MKTKIIITVRVVRIYRSLKFAATHASKASFKSTICSSSMLMPPLLEASGIFVTEPDDLDLERAGIFLASMEITGRCADMHLKFSSIFAMCRRQSHVSLPEALGDLVAVQLHIGREAFIKGSFLFCFFAKIRASISLGFLVSQLVVRNIFCPWL